jgi:virginiamycin B lyase
MSKGLIVPAIAGALLYSALAAHGQSVTLPDGNGKEIVATTCGQCHGLNQVVRAGYTRAGWANTVAMMVNAGAKLTPDQVTTVVDYLAKNFPEKAGPKAVIVPGPVHVTIKEWVVPTPGSRPHDPLAMPDGSIWYSGQMANVLGRLDPKTGAIKEYALPAKSGPHGLIGDPSGDIWYTANFGAYIGRLDPKDGKVVQFPMPDAAARDPHTLLFDRHGIIWFTVQGGNMVGRLDPKSGKIALVALPSPRSNPYGMVIDSKGVPFFDEFGANRIARLDPETMALYEYELPNPAARPRRVAKTSDDIIWYSDYGRGYLGRLDPVTGKVTEWPSPSGPQSRPYGMAVIDDVIWYSESGTEPNTLVRFDPKTEKFQSWAIPSGGGVVRNMVVTRDKGLALACSGVNRVALVEIR